MKTLYVAGPMTGVPRFNFPLFDAVSAALRADGHQIISPAETDHEQTRAAAMASPDGKVVDGVVGAESWGDCLARDVKMLADGVDVLETDDQFRARIKATGAPPDGSTLELHRAVVQLPIDGIAFLPNWNKSKGARLEAFVGLLTKKEFYTVTYWPDDEDGPAEAGLTPVTAEWVQHMLALDWAEGIRMHTPV